MQFFAVVVIYARHECRLDMSMEISYALEDINPDNFNLVDDGDFSTIIPVIAPSANLNTPAAAATTTDTTTNAADSSSSLCSCCSSPNSRFVPAPNTTTNNSASCWPITNLAAWSRLPTTSSLLDVCDPSSESYMDRGNHMCELGASSLLGDELDESRVGKKIRPRLTSGGNKSKSVSCPRTTSKLVESVMLNVSSAMIDTTTKTINNSTAVVKKHMSTDKPPEPYADIIAKAILSNTFNLMQLKEIYTYMSDK